MTFGEVEFLDGSDDPDSDPGPATARRFGPTAAGVVAMVAWLAAAALSLAAPWQTVYTVTQPGPAGSRAFYSLDGWGRLHVASAGSASGHAGRYGIVLCVCCALFLVAAVSAAIRERGGQRAVSPRIVFAAAVAAPALCAGAAGTLLLDLRADVESVAGSAGIRFGYGPFLWWCLGAILCAIAGIAAHLHAEQRRAAAAGS